MGFWKKLLDAILGAEGSKARAPEDTFRRTPPQAPAADPQPAPEAPEERIPGTFLPLNVATGRGRTAPFGRALVKHVLRVPRRTLTFLATHKKDRYRTHRLPKPGGGERRLDEPCPALKKLQKRIKREILDRIILHRCCHGFRKEHSILTNAQAHGSREVVVCLDIRDFFPSVTFPRVFGLFTSLGVPKRDAGLLARLLTHEGRLPQGAPTSPAVANLVCRRLDRRLSALAESAGASYSRYADDLAFSGPLAVLGLLPLARRIVNEEGFELAKEKTRVMRRGSRQKVCGVVVNEGPRLPRDLRRRVRAMFHRASLPPAERRGPAAPESVLAGYASYFKMFGEKTGC